MNTMYSKKCWQEHVKTIIQFTNVKTLLYPSVLNLAMWRQLVFTRGNKMWNFFLIEFLSTTKHSCLCLQCYWLTVYICRCSSQHSQEKNKKNFAKPGFCTGCCLLNFIFSGHQNLYQKVFTVCENNKTFCLMNMEVVSFFFFFLSLLVSHS